MLRRKFLACVLALGLALAAPLALAVTTFERGATLIQGETFTGRKRVNLIHLVETTGGAGGLVRILAGGAAGPVIIVGTVGANDTVALPFYSPKGQVIDDLYVDACPVGVSVVVFTESATGAEP